MVIMFKMFPMVFAEFVAMEGGYVVIRANLFALYAFVRKYIIL